MTDVLTRLKNVVRSGEGWTARCPAHSDGRNSLSIHHRGGRWLLKCHAGCGFEEITAALGTSAADFFDDKLDKRGHGGRGLYYPPTTRATAQHS
jgi:putative DNA primase/helicase